MDKCSSDARKAKHRNSEGPGPTPSLQQNNTSVQILIEAFRTKQAHSCCLWCGRCGKRCELVESLIQRGRKIDWRKPGKHASLDRLEDSRDGFELSFSFFRTDLHEFPQFSPVI